MARGRALIGWSLLAAAVLALAGAPARAEQAPPVPPAPEIVPSGVCRDADRPASDMPAAAARTVMRCLLNHVRRQHGLARMTPHRALQRAGTGHAAAMSFQNFFSHAGLDGRRLAERVGLFSRWRDWRWAGEVLGWACARDSAPRAMVNAWWASLPHRRTILDPRARRIGVGFAFGTPFDCDGVTWAIELGVRY